MTGFIKKVCKNIFLKPDHNENNLKRLSNASGGKVLVPAAAVIPARLVYIKIVVIKKFVVWIYKKRYILVWREESL